MAAGFIMACGASMFHHPSPETYMSKRAMVDEFGILHSKTKLF
jgi:hypothetical protein